MLLLLLVVAAVGLLFAPLKSGITVLALIISALLFILIAKGFYMLQPNQAAVITLFGSYRGIISAAARPRCPRA